MRETFYDMETRRTYINGEHLILAKADLKRQRKQEKLARDFEAQQKAKVLREQNSGESPK